MPPSLDICVRISNRPRTLLYGNENGLPGLPKTTYIAVGGRKNVQKVGRKPRVKSADLGRGTGRIQGMPRIQFSYQLDLH